MDVVAHPALSENSDSSLIAILLQSIQKDRAVSRSVKDDLSIRPTLGEVVGKSKVKRAGHFEACIGLVGAARLFRSILRAVQSRLSPKLGDFVWSKIITDAAVDHSQRLSPA